MVSAGATIRLSAAASAHISTILARHPHSVGLRLSVKKTGCSGYRYLPKVVDQVVVDDIRIDTEYGIAVFVDKHWLAVLAGTFIDLVEQDLGQKKLVYNNPNVDDECGCGESFSIKKSS